MISENERHYAEMVLYVIDTVECPMLMFEGEKAIVRKALKAYLENNDTADTPQTEAVVKPYKPTNREILDAIENSDCPWK